MPLARRTRGLAIFGASALVPIGLGAQFDDAILAWARYRELYRAAFSIAAAELAGGTALFYTADRGRASGETRTGAK
ncbi:MAG TPA: hypothetical protein VIL43_14095 [Burkholderiales bacterium]